MPDDITDEFLDAELGDPRRTRRLGKVVAAMASRPAASISAAQGGWAETAAAFRLLNSSAVTPGALLAPHQEVIVQRCQGQDCVLVIQDTTELDYSHMSAVEGLGPLNKEERRGFYMHSLHAVTEPGLPLGVLGIKYITRDDAHFGPLRTHCKLLPISEKESSRWLEGYLRTQELAERLPACQVVSISDREGDIYEVFDAWRQSGRDPETPRAQWLIRASQDRLLEKVEEERDGEGGGDGEVEAARLFEALEQAPVLGSTSFEMKGFFGPKKVRGQTAMRQRTARTVHQEIRACSVTLKSPRRRGGVKMPAVTFHAIAAREISPPEGEEPVSWLLLTSLKCDTLEEALRVVALYRRRWDIEVFHRVLKTGCRVERMQMKTREALFNALALYAVVAWRILYLTHLGRECPEIGCGCVFEEAEWKPACAVVKRKDPGEPTLGEFIAIVGKLGGHLGRKGDGPPGPQSMWRGLERIRDFALAWRASRGE